MFVQKLWMEIQLGTMEKGPNGRLRQKVRIYYSSNNSDSQHLLPAYFPSDAAKNSLYAQMINPGTSFHTKKRGLLI